ncbi:MAG: DUF6124 family protein [Pseudomonas sp.]
MFKATPNPPGTDDVSPYDPLDPKKLNEAAERALDHYLKPSDPKTSRKPSTIYTVAPGIDIEELLANACESFASAKVIASDCAGFLEGPQRNTILGVAQLIMLGELAVSRALDSLELKADSSR